MTAQLPDHLAQRLYSAVLGTARAFVQSSPVAVTLPPSTPLQQHPLLLAAEIAPWQCRSVIIPISSLLSQPGYYSCLCTAMLRSALVPVISRAELT